MGDPGFESRHKQGINLFPKMAPGPTQLHLMGTMAYFLGVETAGA